MAWKKSSTRLLIYAGQLMVQGAPEGLAVAVAQAVTDDFDVGRGIVEVIGLFSRKAIFYQRTSRNIIKEEKQKTIHRRERRERRGIIRI
jgi:hypothetical protein